MNLNETYKITSSNNLWIRSSSSNGIDVNRINCSNPLYLTQDLDYAYYYAQFKNKDSILMVQIDEIELCHLYDAKDYTVAATEAAKQSDLPMQMADIFQHIEPYFSFNTNPSIRLRDGRVPDSYLEAADFVMQKNSHLAEKCHSFAELIQNDKYKPCGFEAILANLSKLVVGYSYAFDAINDYYCRNKIPKYVKNNYVDILQYIFFNILNKELGYKGYYCPEQSRYSRSIFNKDREKEKYYFGHDGHTHPCLAVFDKTAVQVKAIIPKEMFYVAFSKIVSKNEDMLQYKNRNVIFNEILNNYNAGNYDSRAYTDDSVASAKSSIMYVIKKNERYGMLPPEKRTRDQQFEANNF